ncbi:MMPL family transporter [Persicirhabdus sediminis]|uniref:MMPL family transporter n=1 Tax=Persicirhabdus sediminis TaxID=454144 RepID=A0A8J7SK75_9BACT|nr:MMPL family transporter [Persicirhabdus sediminis]MBK1791864.1 MMPL family transporter [Persicirhabdus sediminis]
MPNSRKTLSSTASWILVILLASWGITQLKLDTDILGVFPSSEPEIKALRSYQDVIEDGGELIVTLRCSAEDAGLLAEQAELLAELYQTEKLASEVRYRPAWEQSAGALGELVAYAWVNGSAGEFQQLEEKLSTSNSSKQLSKSLETLATNMDAYDIAITSRDPFDLFNHSAFTQYFASANTSDNGYESADGQMHLLILKPAVEFSGFREADQWLQNVRQQTELWRLDNRSWIEIGMTGGPVFASEIGAGIQRDMRGTVGLTIIACTVLFWILLRRKRLLMWLGAMLAITFFLTLGIGGLVLGEISMMSVGFASILIGLAVDYGMVICQEVQVTGANRKQLEIAVRKAIIWAALTTATVFGALSLSSLPGIRQLGILVAIGILVGAAVMLSWFLPIVVKSTKESAQLKKKSRFLPARMATCSMAILLVLASWPLVQFGVPKLNFDLDSLHPSQSEAKTQLDLIRESFPNWDNKTVNIVSQSLDDEAMVSELQMLEKKLHNAEENGLIDRSSTPLAFWPNRENQQTNQQSIKWLLTNQKRLEEEALEIGFTNQALVLTRSFFSQLSKFSNLANSKTPYYPSQAETLTMLNHQISRDTAGAFTAISQISPNDFPLVAQPHHLTPLKSINTEHSTVTGWTVLRPVILPLIERDILRVFIPMGILLISMLVFVFRDWRDVLAALLCLCLPPLLLNVFMQLTPFSWNFLNVIAVPLLLGMGMDYSIHMIFSLRRYRHQPEKVWHGTCKALIYCSLTTSIGFGALSLASNEALKSMGIICAAGILICMAFAVFFLPGIWRSLHKQL